MHNKLGHIHSIETFSTADGPGIRFVAFLQGCNFRCQYCHNPDTWATTGGKEWSATDLLNKALQYQSYYRASSGGITASGGEPLLQPEFLAEFFRLAKAEGLHTCLDTAGDIARVSAGQLDAILANTDLVLYDVKEANEIRHKEIAGRSMAEPRQFLQTVQAQGIPVRLRYVYIKGVNDSEDTLESLKKLPEQFSVVQAIDVLPYHRLGEHKWKDLGLEYPLAGITPPSGEETEMVRKWLS